MRIVNEFKEFAVKGNMVELAIGVVVGGAFGKVIDSLVKDIIMPPLGKLLGGVDFSNLFISLSGGHFNSLAEAQTAGAATWNYGLFINTLLSFVIVAFAMFVVIKMMNRMRKEKVPADPTSKICQQCFSTIDIRATRCSACTSNC